MRPCRSASHGLTKNLIYFVLRMLTRINFGQDIGATIDAMNRQTPAPQSPRTGRMDAKRVDSSAAPCA